MTQQAHRRRLATLEERLKPPEPDMSLGARYIDLTTGAVVGYAPARPIRPGEPVNYRQAIQEAIWYE